MRYIFAVVLARNKRRYVVQRNKRQLLSEFDGVQHRTRRLNPAIALIYQNNNKLQDKKMGQVYLF